MNRRVKQKKEAGDDGRDTADTRLHGRDTATRAGHGITAGTRQHGRDTATRPAPDITAGTRQHGRDTVSRPGHGNTAGTWKHGRDTASRPGHGITAGTRRSRPGPRWDTAGPGVSLKAHLGVPHGSRGSHHHPRGRCCCLGGAAVADAGLWLAVDYPSCLACWTEGI